jgi:hypothetical protein
MELLLNRFVLQTPHTLNRTTAAISNSCADVFLSRSSERYYHSEPNCYPFKSEHTAQLRSKMKGLWIYHMCSGGSERMSIKQEYMFRRKYWSIEERIDLFVRAGLRDEKDSREVIKKVYPRGMLWPSHHNPSFEVGLGVQLHSMEAESACLTVAAMACKANFNALMGWNQFSSLLIQGAWPWLRQYSKAYAQVIFTTMVLLFSVIENYEGGDAQIMGARIVRLANKLVGGPDAVTGEKSPWQVRNSPFLSGPKVSVPSEVHLPATVRGLTDKSK